MIKLENLLYWNAPADPEAVAWVVRSPLPLGFEEEFLFLPHAAQRRRYSPLSMPELFRCFADLPQTKEAFRAFAGNWGLLGVPCHSTDEGEGETFELWAERVRWMSWCCSLWDALRAGTAAALKPFLREDSTIRGFSVTTRVPTLRMPSLSDAADDAVDGRDGRDGVNADVGPEDESPVDLSPQAMEDILYRKPDKGEIRAVANVLLAQVVNAELDLVSTESERLNVLPGEDHLRLVTRTRQGTLWLALVWQLADAISEERSFQKCPVCGTWFLLAPGVNKADRLTCSVSCRNKAYRARKARAVELAGVGKKPREIAKEVGSTVATVNKWIAESQQEG